MTQTDTSPAGKADAQGGGGAIRRYFGGLISLIVIPAVLSLLALVIAVSHFASTGWDERLPWLLLGTTSALAIACAYQQRISRTQSRHIRELKQAEGRLQAKLAEQARSSQAAQEAAEENRKTIWKVFKASPDPMAVLDGGTEGIFLAINQAFTATFGYARDDTLGKTPVQLKLLANPENLVDFSRRLEPEGYVPDAETAFRTRDGRLIWGLLSAVTVEVAGKPYVNWIVRDITDRKRMEAELVAAREAAESASRAKSEFLSSMSHEIRTPMNAVLGMAQLLAETELSQDQRHYLDLMVVSGNSLLELINSILDLAKIESGRMQVEQSEFDVRELIDETVASFGVRAHSKGLELVARIGAEVPQRLIGDQLRLRQVLTNLLGNAIKFTESGEIVVALEEAVISDQVAELKFTVADTGIGISPDKLDAIFHNFTQADSSTTRKYGGSGLGLAIAHRLVGLLGGAISVESEPGKGSRFSFTCRFSLPLTTTGPTVKTGLNLAGYRMLIADDNRASRRAILALLNDSGVEVDEASNGNNALGAILQAAEEGRPYHLVLLDMAMPSPDGFEVAHRLRSYSAVFKSLLPMLSSDELKLQIPRLQQLGISIYLVKPVTRKGLLGSIQRLINESHSGVMPVPQVHSNAQRTGGRILVAEDSPENRLVMAAYLRSEPYQIDFAEDGKQALNKFVANPYDLVLMDIQMPEMDGLETTRAIRRWELQHDRLPTPIVALTAYALEEDVRRALAAGCNRHISKPLKKQALLECVQEAMQLDGTAISDCTRSRYYA